METKPLGGWCCTAAWAAEGCTWLAALLPRLATLWLWNGVLCGFVPLFSPAPVAVTGGLLLTGWLSGAMRLGRFAWYAALTDCRPGEWPGATAFVPALVASGLPNEKFCFEGFLPQKKGRQTRLKELAEEPRTIIFYESPYRLVKTLTQFAEMYGEERQVSVSREISKLHEETVRGTLAEVIAHFSVNEPKGEIVIVLAGSKEIKNSTKKEEK